MVDTLAQAVAQNRTALIALTALKNYDNYTFTHMVNVSILTMAQARALGIDGPLLREFGLAGLMHDIGKVRTPAEILNKPAKLTDDEFAIMKRHVVDGAEILRRTPEIPPIAPVVAFEHHLRRDGTGYPDGREARDAEPGDDAVLDLGRLRRDAIAAQVPAGVPERSDPGRARSATTASSSISTSCGASCSSSASTRPATSCASTRARSPWCCGSTRRIRTGRACAWSSTGRDSRWSATTMSTSGRARPKANGPRRSMHAVDPADYDLDPLTLL